MVRKELVFFSVIVLMGFLDWLTTVSGVLFFGAAEVNPLLSGLTRSSMLLFSAAKLTAVVLAGLAFYKAAALSKHAASDWHFTTRFLNGGCSLTALALTALVVNNMIAIFRF